MNSNEKYCHLRKEVDVLLAEQKLLAAQGPRFIVKHGYHLPGTLCTAGETVEEVCLWENLSEYRVPLAESSLVLFDCLGRHRMPLTAAKIEEIMLNHPFYTTYGSNRTGPNTRTSFPRRATVKVFIRRIREQLSIAFHEAGSPLDPCDVLGSEATDSNVVAYRLRASIGFVHMD